MAALNTFRTDGEDFGEQILSKVVKAGRRTYFLDVRATRANDYFLTITESRKKTAPDGTVSYDRHKIFLYKEDFSKFLEGLEEVIGFIKREKISAAGSHEDRSFMKDNWVLLGFSGGIDSFAAVGLLQAAGYHVTALTLDMRGDSALLEKARLRAGALGIPWRMRSVRERFEREVVDYFTDSYFRGRTPAPCTRCNSRIKWPCLAAEADALGIRYIATGHYFRITSAGGKRYVTRAADNRKDQSYYLWDLPQEVLDRVLTPMGTVIKRNIVEELADRRESMGVCFLEGRPCRDFLRSRDKTEALRPGPIIDSAGHRLGTHDGAALYTIGQKKGLDLPPGWAVVAIDTAANRIVAGEEKLLLHRTLEVGECRLVESDEVFGARDIRAVIRGIGRNPEGYAAVFPAASGIRIELEDPAWAPAAGQPVVLYRGERVVGGGILERYY